LQLIKQGEQPGQAVGYLPDGTMVVVNEADTMIGESIEAEVESTIQTSAGRMLFARVAGEAAVRASEPEVAGEETLTHPEIETDHSPESQAEPAVEAEESSASPRTGPFPPQK